MESTGKYKDKKMKTFLDRFYDYVHSPEGFNCVRFQYKGIHYQVVSGASICFTGNDGKKHRIMLPDDIEQILDAKVLSDNKSLREVWSTSDENDLSPDFY